MNYSSKIFEMLGIKPNEVFKLEKSDLYYQITKDLDLLWSAYPNKNFLKSATKSIIQLLTGEFTIIRIPKNEFIVTPKEKAAIEYARAYGCKWIARDKGTDLWAYNHMPIKVDGCWYWQEKSLPIQVDISFIKWEDKEPFYIGPEVIFKVVYEYESINADETSCVCQYFNSVDGTCINTNRCLSNGRKDKCQYSNKDVT